MNGIVVAPQPRAAEVGADILRAGGNAFDAAVAAAFMQCVLDPFMCGLGGIGVAQLYDAARDESLVVDFYGRVGSRARPEQWARLVRRTATGRTYVRDFANAVGYGSILIPGTVAGLAALHARGTRPWPELLAPAIATMREGFPLYAYIADYFSETHQYPSGGYFPPFERYIRTTPDFARLWLRDDGRPRRVGEWLTNPDYAATLDILATEGPMSFYRGTIAARIAADFAAHDAPITAADLADCTALIGAPLHIDYRGYTVATSPPGGVTILQALGILAGTEPTELADDRAETIHLLASALRIAAGERGKLTGELPRATLERFVAPASLAGLRARLGAAMPEARPAAPSLGTTHLTVADQWGNVVALTHTLALGSGVVTPGLGFQYNNGMSSFDPLPGRPRSLAPGRARVSPMAPTLVYRDRRPVIALGSPGSNAISSAIVQVLHRLLDRRQSPLEAVAAPRVHCEGGPLLLETRTPRAVARELAGRGWTVQERPFAYDPLQGRVQIVARDGARWVGASDPRRDGGVALTVD